MSEKEQRESSQIHKQDILEFSNLETEAEIKNAMFIGNNKNQKAVAVFQTP